MHPHDCPAWNYEDYKNYRQTVHQRSVEVLVNLRKGILDTAQSASDSRYVHRSLFSELVMPEHDYFAGHYRGENFYCLKHYLVCVADDPTVGFQPAIVLSKMEQIAELIAIGVSSLDDLHKKGQNQLSPEDKLINTVAFACSVFVEFLRVHPYANGNGHAGRFIMWSILGRYGYWPEKFPLDPRPPNFFYIDGIREYRKGNKEILENYVLSCL